jgi:hypothetical protein
MRQGGINLTDEVARVHRELTAFRDQLLTALIGPCEAYLEDRAQDPSRWPYLAQIEKSVRTLRHWEWAVSRLLDALSLARLGAADPEPDWSEYEEFLWQSVSASSHLVREGRIVWRIELFIGWDFGLEYMLARSGAASDCEAQEPGPECSFDELHRRLPEVKRWLLALPVDGSVLFNALSCVLAPVSDLDPAFARLALDLDTWRSIVRTDQTLDEATRSQRLGTIDSGDLPHAINNALLHVLGALASNHFGVIADFLDHPCLSGAYTGLIPHYLFAVLLEKVKTLRSLAMNWVTTPASATSTSGRR